MTLSAAAISTCGAHKQFVPSTLLSERDTVGGSCGEFERTRRTFYGSVRDLVIGMKVALATVN